jgi:hypothetical protein
MEFLIQFLTFIAWPIASIATLTVCIRIICWSTYTENEESIDLATKGYVRTFPITTPALLALISWAWIYIAKSSGL